MGLSPQTQVLLHESSVAFSYIYPQLSHIESGRK